MTTVLERYQKKSRRRRRAAAKKHQRLDIQGLRMVAVLIVFANHLWGFPRGGFVGVDVFFVISGFLITGNLLRTAESTGTVSFWGFYKNRIRRIVPAATVVLIAIYLTALVLFLPFRSSQVGWDAVAAFFFFANWRFAVEGTDYFTQTDVVSPIQHYWSLSIEEQFYFVWPALIFIISVIVIRRGWTHAHRMQLAAGVMGIIVAASLGWALLETATAPTWAYFNTFARVWELGIGALLATAVGLLARIPTVLKPVLSWAGLAMIGATLFLLSDGASGFPAPWALLPVAGAALVIASGVDGEARYQGFLRNPVSTYVGDISYSLYLVHWPVIVFLGTLMEPGLYYSLMVLALAFGLSIASYHFVENPLRRANPEKTGKAFAAITERRYQPQRSTKYAAVGVVSLLTVAACVYVMRPVELHLPPDVTASAPGDLTSTETKPQFGPLTSGLQGEITQALKATEWPALDPSMDAAMEIGTGVPADYYQCGTLSVEPDDMQRCTWGSPAAPMRIVIVGDSLAVAYGYPFREIALNSNGQIQVHLAGTGGCQFSDAPIFNSDQSVTDACPERKQRVVDFINATKPAVVIVTNVYSQNKPLVGGTTMANGDWSKSLGQIIDKFRSNVGKVVLLSPPPADKNIQECYGNQSSVPADCISDVTDAWHSEAREEQDLAKSLGLTWIDSRPWFCSDAQYCPSFVGSTPVKRDLQHITAAYGQKVSPMIGETFKAAGIF